MGMILEPTVEMKEYRIEARRESFYMYGHSMFLYPDASDGRRGTVEIDYNDIPKIRAALDLAEKHQNKG